MQINRNNLAKITMAIAIALGFLGVETKAYASQEVDNAKIVGYGCVDGNGICFLTIDKNHPITKETASCLQKTFAWNSDKNPERIDLVKKAYNEGILVRLQYSDFNCFDGGAEIPNQFMDLISIDLKK
jgi:hypothetical protein